jgi:hypothetical protein
MFCRKLILLGIILVWFPAKGQNKLCIDACTFSLSGSGTALSNIYSVNNNQAGLANFRKAAFAINYNNRYFIPELAGQSILASIPLGKGTFGTSIDHFGSKFLNENKLSVSYGLRLFNWLNAGMEMNYHQLRIETPGEKSETISGNIGLQAITKDHFIIGIQLENPTKSQYVNSGNNTLYSSFKAGISYSVPASFLITSQLDWDDFEKIAVIAGTEYWLIKNLSIRFGMRLVENPSFSFGTGMIYNRIAVDFGFQQHPVLGLSSAVSIIIQLNKHDS